MLEDLIGIKPKLYEFLIPYEKVGKV